MIKQVCVLSLLVAEALVLYTCAEWIASGYSAGQQHALGAWTFVLVVMAAYFLPGVVEWFGLGERKAAAVIAVVGLLLIYLLVRVAVGHDARLWDLGWTTKFMTDPNPALRDGRYYLIGAVLLVVVWVRGSLRAHDEIELDMVSRRVAVPFAIVTVIVVLGAETGRSGEIARAGIAFYGAEVVGLACSQLAMTGATVGDIRAGGVIATLLGATAALVAAMFVVLALGVLYLGPIIGPPLGEAINFVLTIILTPIGWALNKLFTSLFGGANPFKQIDPTQLNIQGGPKQTETQGHGAWYDATLFLLRALVFVLVFAAIAGVVWFVVRLRRRVRSVRLEDQAVGRTGSFSHDLRSVMGSLFSRSARPPSKAEGISRLYLEVLTRGEAAARPRLAGETAGEFAPVLADTFETDVTDEITRAFEQARYAGREPDARTLRALQERWNTVR